MKYIRTKDGRIITFAPKEKYKNDKATFDWFVANYCGGGINVLKIANTIEELCDYIVYNEYAENGNGKLILKKISADWVKEQLKNVMLDAGANIKLAILTDKGLIYVAKMNDKAELELL